MKKVIKFLVNDCIDSLEEVGNMELQEDGSYIHGRLVGDKLISQEEYDKLNFDAIWGVVDGILKKKGYDVGY
ncbi:MAG: hypothetical protein KC550_07190 [Nanoarchaeota archaeon]|nr:hypothetical protein [Nanoarchaeota archaeon]